jgi:two-component system chemotaxis sensor kinase CheA
MVKGGKQMVEHDGHDPILEMFIFESTQMLEKLETVILDCENVNDFNTEAINEIFRIMHTIKSSSAMMRFVNISTLAHSIEDLFFYLREKKPHQIDFATLSDLIFEGLDFIKVEIHKIVNGENADGEASVLIESIHAYLKSIIVDIPCVGMQPEQSTIHPKWEAEQPLENILVNPNARIFKVIIQFVDDCGMENIRAYQIIHNITEIADDCRFIPGDILDNHESADFIKQHGFQVFLTSNRTYQEVYEYFAATLYVKDLVLIEVGDEFSSMPLGQLARDEAPSASSRRVNEKENAEAQGTAVQQGIISVHIAKLDKLMDLVGELVISEAMVTQNPVLKELQLENFQKAARQLRKITSELQDTVMSIRMVPLATTFHKTRRLVRDMCKKLDKEVNIDIVGEDTELDKNIIEQISDPIIHLVRNAVDHGIEPAEERTALGKPSAGTIILEAKNVGSDVLISMKDDGRGLNKTKIIKKANENGLLQKTESEMSDRDIFNLILLPGFSTKDSVSEFSGRGVGMDVVVKNLEKVGGAITVNSVPGTGTVMTMKIPLTLAIIDGMNIRVGTSSYTLPITSIKESFRPKGTEVITDPDGNEMIMVRGQCYPILRLHEYYSVKTEITDFASGVLIMVEHDDKSLCVFADELLGQQQVVVKTLPPYIKNFRKIEGLTGCTLLGDGSISLILDTAELIGKRTKELVPANGS